MLSKVRKKPQQDSQLAITSKKFSSNGSLLSHNGLKSAYSEPDMSLDNQQQQQQRRTNGHNEGPYVNIIEGKLNLVFIFTYT